MSQPKKSAVTVGAALEQAIAFHQRGQLPEAERLYRAILQKDPRHPDANHNLGVLAVGLGKPQAALPFFRIALKADPQPIQYWLSYVDALIATGDFASARRSIASAEKRGVAAERFEPARKRMAATPAETRPQGNEQPSREADQNLVTLFSQGRFNEVEELARTMTQRFPTHGFGWRVLGAVLNRRGRNEEALAPAQKAVALLPELDEAHVNLGIILQSVGRLDEAAASFRRALEITPRSAAIHNNLGGVLNRLGQMEAAAASFQRAIDIRPDYAEAHTNLGGVLRELGRLEGAEASCRRAIDLKPDSPAPLINLGSTLKAMGRFAEAEASCRKAIELNPASPEAHHNLAGILFATGRTAEAAAGYRRAIEIKPDFAEAHNSLGAALKTLGSTEEAVACYRQAISTRANYAEAYSNLAMALQDLGRLQEAETNSRRAVALKPNFVGAHVTLGNALLAQDRTDEAEASYRQALAIDPRDTEALNNLGGTVFRFGRMAEAEELFHRVIAIKPDYAEAYNNLSMTLNAMGQPEEAIAFSRRALELKPDYAAAHSNLLFWLNYPSNVSATDVFTAHRDWEKQHTKPGTQMVLNVPDRDPERRLRIGYVSPDLRQHSVAYFFEPLLREHDRSICEVFCYAEVAQPDAVTARLQGLADHWLRTVGLSNETLAQRIAADRIDILVDLAGHTANHRLEAFALKPAPVQVTWLGYPNTTGLRAVDYRLVDEITDPAGGADALATENLIRLDNGFLCYEPPATAPAPAASPSVARGTITFGSFNNPAKLSPVTLAAWSKLLGRVPGSQLLLKGRAFADPMVRAAFMARLQTHGIAAERVSLQGKTDGMAEHLALYAGMDIALDSFPYNGTTTTCEALWMGVPVVTLCGERHAGRVGASLLTRIGLGELVAHSVEDYLDVAARLATDPDRLANYRQTIRKKMAASPLCDAPAFARQIEAAYRQMWRSFSAGATPHPF